MIDRDPWAEALVDIPEADDIPGMIDDGATIVSVERHPIYGQFYRCKAWVTQYPWYLHRKSTVKLFRGDPFNNPDLLGEAALIRLRKNGQDVQTVAVGFIEGEPIVDVWLDGDVEPRTGDTLSFWQIKP